MTAGHTPASTERRELGAESTRRAPPVRSRQAAFKLASLPESAKGPSRASPHTLRKRPARYAGQDEPRNGLPTTDTLKTGRASAGPGRRTGSDRELSDMHAWVERWLSLSLSRTRADADRLDTKQVVAGREARGAAHPGVRTQSRGWRGGVVHDTRRAPLAALTAARRHTPRQTPPTDHFLPWLAYQICTRWHASFCWR